MQSLYPPGHKARFACSPPPEGHVAVLLIYSCSCVTTQRSLSLSPSTVCAQNIGQAHHGHGSPERQGPLCRKDVASNAHLDRGTCVCVRAVVQWCSVRSLQDSNLAFLSSQVSYERLMLLCRLPDSIFLRPWVYPALKYFLRRGDEELCRQEIAKLVYSIQEFSGTLRSAMTVQHAPQAPYTHNTHVGLIIAFSCLLQASSW